MVQSFLVPLPRGRSGRVWITTAEALAVPGFGRPWVAAQLTALREELGAREFNRALARRRARVRRRRARGLGAWPLARLSARYGQAVFRALGEAELTRLDDDALIGYLRAARRAGTRRRASRWRSSSSGTGTTSRGGWR